MKRILSILAVVALVAMTVQAVEVKSENVAGVYTVNVPANGAFVAVSVALDPFDSADATLEGVLGVDQLRVEAKGSPGDRVYLYNGSGYDIFLLQDLGGGVQWYHDSGAASNPALEAGEAMWIRSAIGSAGAEEVTITGQAIENSSVSTPISGGLQFLGYPFSAKIGVNDTTFVDDATKEAKGQVGDRVYLWNGTGYDILLVNDPNDYWGLDSSPNTPYTGDIALGQGFWYKAAVGGFNWSETNKYLGNL